MFNKLDASNYDNSALFYDKNFELILSKITLCYVLMKTQNTNLENDENKIRDVLYLEYLNNDEMLKRVNLEPWIFLREVLEDSTVGRTDIRIISFDTFVESRKAYYIIECKRLNNSNTTGKTGLNAEYIKNGISRFTKNYYSSYYRVNGMIGFVVEKMDIHKNVRKINKLLKDFETPITNEYITRDTFIPNFEFHYHSTHLDDNCENLKIYHLMFDFSESVTPTEL